MEEILMIGDDVRDDVLGLFVFGIYHGISTLPLRSPGGGAAGRAGQDRQVQAGRRGQVGAETSFCFPRSNGNGKDVGINEQASLPFILLMSPHFRSSIVLRIKEIKYFFWFNCLL